MAKNKQLPQISGVIPAEQVEGKILFIRGKKVMLDRDLAELYGVTTGNLNKAVNRNIDRFPGDFMFQLTHEEMENLRFQFGSLGLGKYSKYLSYVFTQEGVAMLSGVLHSKRAVLVNIQIMRAFVKLRELMLSHKGLANKIEQLEKQFCDHDKKITIIFDAIRQLLESEEGRLKKGPMGFTPNAE